MTFKTKPMSAYITSRNVRASIGHEFGAFRKRLFIDNLGWRLSAENDVELDEFDTDRAEYGLIYAGGSIVAGFRAIQTTYPYLAATHFPDLAKLRKFPVRQDYYEISRFGILAATQQLNLGLLNYALMFEFARRRNAAALIAIADLAHERLLRAIGIRTRRYGPPGIVGKDNAGEDIIAVAGEIPLSEQSTHLSSRLISLLENQVELKDETHIFGRHGLLKGSVDVSHHDRSA